MSKRPTALETTILSLEILRRIPRRRRVTATELHLQLEGAGFQRDLRTIQRQLDFLSGHFDIERDERTKPYTYRWKELAAGLSVPMLGEQESLLLALAEQHLKNLLPAQLKKAMEGFFAQARTNVGSPKTSTSVREWSSKVRVVGETQPLIAAVINPQVFEAVSVALFGNRWLAVEYRNTSERLTDARVMPLGLAQQGPRLYLVCRFEGFENERTLAMHRIVNAEASTLTFRRPKEFSLQRYDDEGRFGIGDGRLVRLSFRITKDAGAHLYETPLSVDQVILENGNHLDVSATVTESKQLHWWLTGFGPQIAAISLEPISEEPSSQQL